LRIKKHPKLLMKSNYAEKRLNKMFIFISRIDMQPFNSISHGYG
jgi:hypothetical protein